MTDVDILLATAMMEQLVHAVNNHATKRASAAEQLAQAIGVPPTNNGQESDTKMTTSWAFDTPFNILDNKRPSYVDTRVSEEQIKHFILAALFDIEKPLSANGFLERDPASTESARYVELERSWHDLIEQFRCTAYTKYTENNGPRYEMTRSTDNKLEVKIPNAESVSDWNNCLVAITSGQNQERSKHWIVNVKRREGESNDEKATPPMVTIFPSLTSGGSNPLWMSILAPSTPVVKQLQGIYSLLQNKDWLVTQLQSPPLDLPNSIIWRSIDERKTALDAVRALAGLTAEGRNFLELQFKSRTIRRANVDLPIRFNPNPAQTAALLSYANILECNQGPAGSMS